jgi:hypothetical protein
VRIAFTKLRRAVVGTRPAALEPKKIAYEILILSLLLGGFECWVVNAESTLGNIACISTEIPEVKLGIQAFFALVLGC